ncbi:hypothetical protein AGDE_13436 [Angomonas deanei]|nr:hypothetical protein AGDE_13436 [Angomonas deanei]|eukprot:EPY22383.1 hypothetical protein AGDE_13436 [Angomonas deanei]
MKPRNFSQQILQPTSNVAASFDMSVVESPSGAFVLFLVFLSLLGYVLYTVAKSRKETVPNAIEVNRSRETKGWVARQLFILFWAWTVYYGVYTILGYVLLPSTMLWRRHMLPVPTWSHSWLSQLRLYFMCGNFFEGASSRLRAIFLAKKVSEDCADWLLPVSDSVLQLPAESVKKLSQFSSEEARKDAIATFYVVHHSSLLLCLTVLMNVLTLVCKIQTKQRAGENELKKAPTETLPETDAVRDKIPVASDTGEKLHFSQVAETYDPDDADLLSDEALEEEKYWTMAENSVAVVQPSLMVQVVQEGWPSLLGCLYMYLFAVVGGVPVFMTLFYPAAVLSAILVSFFML